MKSLKILVAPIAVAIAGAGLAVPAQARDHRHDSWQLTPARTAEIRQDINTLDRSIDRAVARRTISQREARGLRGQARDVKRMYAQYARGGFTRNEVRNLESRVNSVRVALRMERRDWDGRRG